MGQYTQAINYLKQGLAIAQSINKSEEEAKIRHQLGKLFHPKLFHKKNLLCSFTI